MANVWWKISYDELEFMDEKGEKGRARSTLSLASETSFMSRTTVSTVKSKYTTTVTDTAVSLNTTTLANLGIRVATYKVNERAKSCMNFIL